MPDRLHQRWFLRFKLRENFLAVIGIEPVEHFRNGPDAAVRLAAEIAERIQFLSDDGRYLIDDFRRYLVERGNPEGQIGTLILW